MEAAAAGSPAAADTAAHPPPAPPSGPPGRIVSSSSLSSESSEEDWLIKVCCPGARHRYCRNVRFIKPAKTEVLQNSDEEDELAECTSYQHGAYLESYSPSAYDPFFLKSTDIWKVSVPRLCDPLLKEVQERYLEEGIIQQCDTGRMSSSKDMSELQKADLPLLPLSRQIMNPIEWLKIPSGYVDSEIRQKSRRKMSTARNRSSMDFKCWGDQSWLLPNKRFASARKPLCPAFWRNKDWGTHQVGNQQ